MLRLTTLGTLLLQDHSGPLARARVRALLALLARSGEAGMTRERLCAFLWPESPPDRARHSLDQALYLMRKELGEAAMGGSQDPVVLDAAWLPSDVAEFTTALAEGRGEDAAALYGGPFLDGFHLSDAPEFERWVETERAALHRQYADALGQAAASADARGDADAAAGWWRRLAAAEPFSSRVVLGLMQALAQAGDHGGALEAARVHEVLLEEELGAAPDPAVAALAAELRREPPGPAVAVQAQTREQVERETSPDDPDRSATPQPERAIPPIRDRIPMETRPSKLARSARRSRRRFIAAAGAVIATSAGLGSWIALQGGVPGPNRIALLPITDVSGSDGELVELMHHQLTVALGQLGGVTVVPSSAMRVYRTQPEPAAEVARELRVGALLEGNVFRAGERLRITLQLTDPRSIAQIWSGSYDFDLSGDLFDTVDGVIPSIADGIGQAVAAAADRTPDTGLVTTTLIDRPSGDANLTFGAKLSPDGTRLAWTEPVDGQSAVLVANDDGSDLVRLTHGAWDRDPIWSPDGRWIAYVGESPDYDIFVVPSTGGDPRQLTSGPTRDETRVWLRDGSGVVFVRTDGSRARTLVAPLEDGPPRPLVAAAGGNQWVTPSPDGSRVAFQLRRGAENTIWVQDLAGGEARQLTMAGLEAGSVNMWSPDGRFLAYTSRRTGRRDIWIAEVETGKLRQLTTDINDDWAPVWSPDGRWIALLSNRGGQHDVWVIPATGGPAWRITDDIGQEAAVQWSPDGRSLYFAVDYIDAQIRVMPAHGGAFGDLVGWPGFQVFGANVSPDGRTVLFTSNRSGNLDIWSVPFEGGEPTPFTASSVEDWDPRFSPDGRRVLFASLRAGSADLWVMPADGGGARQLTDWPSQEWAPRWSPDGSKIAFVSNRDSDQLGLWVIPARGGEATRLDNNHLPRTYDDEPVFRWSPDGRTLYYIGFTSSGAKGLFRVPVSGGEPDRLGAHPNIAGGELSADGSHFAYSVTERGWRYVEVIPTAGGPARRLTTQTEPVYHHELLWSPDGSSLLVGAQAFPETTTDLLVVTWPEGVWRQLTRTPDMWEVAAQFTPDGRHVLLETGSLTHRIVSVSVAELLAGRASE